MSKENFEAALGMCISFWGWGKEDRALRYTLEKLRIKIIEPGISIGTDRRNTFRHIHDEIGRTRDTKDCNHDRNPYDYTCRGYLKLPDVKYELESVVEMTINGAQVTMLNVKLACNETATPWCNSKCL
jgi:xylosylprotein 4-beta-galactosyltransferase